jgi:crotonobetainyl-CoA:carnitine CoA-transferase CaiB-like acyl-CoA transferase
VLERARFPCAPVLHPSEVVAAPHLAERSFFPSVPHPARGAVRVTASPYHLDGRPVHPRTGPAYRPGEHTRAVLREVLGYDDARIDALVGSGAAGAP